MFAVPHAAFNYKTKTWETRRYYLPKLGRDFVVLTPIDMLTRDDNWINHADMVNQFDHLPDAVDNDQLRAQIEAYFRSRLSEKPTASERTAAAHATIMKFKELIDLYIKRKEETGDRARSISREKTERTHEELVEQIRALIPDLEAKTEFYKKPWTSYEEARERVLEFKSYIENQDGYQLINPAGGTRVSSEKDVQLYFGLIWCRTEFDVNREPNNGRGPVDFKVSYGAHDKSLIEFKLAKSSSLKRNLEKQVEIYEKANGTRQSVKVIVYYTAEEQAKLARVLTELNLVDDEAIIGIDARNDNKPSASKA
ncbi:hypothetical protein [Rhodococcus ruber]|uniref:hypothetical protein n=1 Tax=Rhodococcus ruber TaxID=1830 RepID=UPI001C11B828|nr:hypothetical protein [Rhodococcus ruber]